MHNGMGSMLICVHRTFHALSMVTLVIRLSISDSTSSVLIDAYRTIHILSVATIVVRLNVPDSTSLILIALRLLELSICLCLIV